MASDELTAHDAAFDRLKPTLDAVVQEVIGLRVSFGYRLALMVRVIAHFTGAAGGLLSVQARNNGGPDLDEAGWGDEVVKLVVDLTKKTRN